MRKNWKPFFGIFIMVALGSGVILVHAINFATCQIVSTWNYPFPPSGLVAPDGTTCNVGGASCGNPTGAATYPYVSPGYSTMVTQTDCNDVFVQGTSQLGNSCGSIDVGAGFSMKYTSNIAGDVCYTGSTGGGSGGGGGGSSPSPDFGISMSPINPTVAPGGTASYLVTVDSLNGMSGPVHLSEIGILPAGMSASFSSPIVSVPSGGTATSNLNIMTTAATPGGVWSPATRGQWTVKSHTAGPDSLDVVAITVTCNPNQINTGATSQCKARVVGGSGNTVRWSVVSGGGTIANRGLYTAPSTAGTAVVQATQGAFSGTASIQINGQPGGPPCATLTYQPATSGFATSTSGPTGSSIALTPADATFYTYVDYGQSNTGSIQPPSASGASACVFDSAVGNNGWIGSAAAFKCTTPSVGSYSYNTGVNGGTSDNDCATVTPQSIGTVTVSNSSPGGGPSISNPNPNPVNPGQPTTITATGGCGGDTWTTSGANGTITAPSNNGTTYNPTDSQQDSYTATVTDSCGQTASTVVNVFSPICDLVPYPPLVIPPQSSDLSWTCQYATYCSITGTDGYSSGPLSGSSGAVQVYPSKTTKYTLVCTGSGSGPGNSTQNTAIVTVSGSNIHETNP